MISNNYNSYLLEYSLVKQIRNCLLIMVRLLFGTQTSLYANRPLPSSSNNFSTYYINIDGGTYWNGGWQLATVPAYRTYRAEINGLNIAMGNLIANGSSNLMRLYCAPVGVYYQTNGSLPDDYRNCRGDLANPLFEFSSTNVSLPFSGSPESVSGNFNIDVNPSGINLVSGFSGSLTATIKSQFTDFVYLCNQTASNLVFTSTDPMQDEIWEYSLDHGANWVRITTSSNYFVLNYTSPAYPNNYPYYITTTGQIIPNIASGDTKIRCYIPKVRPSNVPTTSWFGGCGYYSNLSVNVSGVATENTQVALIYVLQSNPSDYGVQVDPSNGKFCKGNRGSFAIIEANNNLVTYSIVDSIKNLASGRRIPFYKVGNRYSFLPDRTGNYVISFRARSECDSALRAFTKTVYLRVYEKPVMLVAVTNPKTCAGGTSIFNITGVCRANVYNAGGSLVASGNAPPGSADEPTYAYISIPLNVASTTTYRIEGYSCNTENICPVDTTVTIEVVPYSNRLKLEPMCEGLAGRKEAKFLIGLFNEDGTPYAGPIDQVSFSKKITPFQIMPLTGDFWENLASLFRRLREVEADYINSLNTDPQTDFTNGDYEVEVSSPETGLCEKLQFSVWQKASYSSSTASEVEFSGLTFVKGSTSFYNTNIKVKAAAKLYFMSGFYDTTINASSCIRVTPSVDGNSLASGARSLATWEINDGTLNIEPGAELTSKCQMWYGIKVRKTPDSKSDVERIRVNVGRIGEDSVTISNAMQGLSITVTYPNTEYTAESKIRILNTSFINNNTSLYLSSTYDNSAKLPELDKSKIAFNRFTSYSGTMLHPMNAQTFVNNDDANNPIFDSIRPVASVHIIETSVYQASQVRGYSNTFIRFKQYSGNNSSEIFEGNKLSNAMVGIQSWTSGMDLIDTNYNTFENCYVAAIAAYRRLDFIWQDYATYPRTFYPYNIKHCSIKISDRTKEKEGLYNYITRNFESQNPIIKSPLFSIDPSNTPSGQKFTDQNTYGMYIIGEKRISINYNHIIGDKQENTVGILASPLWSSLYADNNINAIHPLDNNKFTDLGIGLKLYGKLTSNLDFGDALAVGQCTFKNCRTGINFFNVKPDYDALPWHPMAILFCNEFLPDTNSGYLSVGVKIEPDAGIIKEINTSFRPGGNVFPVRRGTNRSLLPRVNNFPVPVQSAWYSPATWTSIVNENTDMSRYYSYDNEFVGSHSSNCIVINANAYCKSPSQATPTNLNAPVVEVCGHDFSQVVFPLSRVAAFEEEVTVKEKIEIVEQRLVDLLGRTYKISCDVLQCLEALQIPKGVYLLHTTYSDGSHTTTKLTK